MSSLAPDGTANLAPHSFFTVSCVSPPVIQFTSVGRKDSLNNIEATGEFVVNMTPEGLIEQVNSTGTNFPADVDEFSIAGLEQEPSARVRPPRVAASPAALECTLHSTLSLGDSTIVFGTVVHAAIATDVMNGDRPDARLLRPLGRLSGSEWSRPGEVVKIERLPFERWQEEGASTLDGQ